jgi:hypothetical protein
MTLSMTWSKCLPKTSRKYLVSRHVTDMSETFPTKESRSLINHSNNELSLACIVVLCIVSSVYVSLYCVSLYCVSLYCTYVPC